MAIVWCCLLYTSKMCIRDRYQDIRELLKAGISVYTTVNVQHLESLNDIVASITGITVQERIPDFVFDSADQVELVDIEPQELLERLKDVYKRQHFRRVHRGSPAVPPQQEAPGWNSRSHSQPPVSYTHLDVYKRQGYETFCKCLCSLL